jgi:hypothetical protein
MSAAEKDAAGRPARSGGLAVKIAAVAALAGALAALPLCLIAVPGMMPSAAVLFTSPGSRPT